ncbi:hypothetical protein AVEN_162633-1, partial [Araneus ventricosus]
SQRNRTTSYHPASNGMVERFHRQLKDAVKCHCLSTLRWTSVLPSVLLGIHASLKEDLGFFPLLNYCTGSLCVFLEINNVHRPLEQPYDGSYRVLCRTDKVFILDARGQKRTVSVDRLKPAYILGDTM